MPVRVVIADDHSLVRQGLRRCLETAGEIDVLAEAGGGDEAVSLVSEHRPDIALLDIRMDRLDGIEATRRIRDRSPDTDVVILTAHDERRFVVEAVRAGAKGYVLKTRDADHLVQTVRLVASGNMVIDPEVVLALSDELSGPKARDETGGLTDRELEVLQLLAFGHTNRQIAERLYVSPDTVKTHLEHIYQKLGTNDRTAAVAKALRKRLIQ